MAGFLWALLGVVAGALIAVQAPANAALARGLGSPFAASASSFVAGAIVLVTIALVQSKVLGVPIAFSQPPPWLFFAGGCLGAGYVTIVLVLASKLGAATTMAFIVAGQLVAGMFLDRIGFLGMAVREISLGRLAGVALLIAGALMVRTF